MALPGHEFLTAHFSDNERTNVEVYWVTPDGLETRVENIEAKTGDPAWEDLLTHISLEELHQTTYKQMQEQDAMFKEDVIKIAKERGLIHDLTNLNNVETMKLIVDFIFVFKESSAFNLDETLFLLFKSNITFLHNSNFLKT